MHKKSLESVSKDKPETPMLCEKDWLLASGALADLVRAMDWSTTPLGPCHCWPRTLQTVVNLVLASSFPMAILWGSELILVYNDGYSEIAGSKHPQALGKSTRDIWPEVWEFNRPIFEKVMTGGKTIHLENQLLRISRHGPMEDAYFTLSYSPIYIEDGAVGGTLVTLIEMTKAAQESLRLLAEVREEKDKLESLINSISDEVWFADTQKKFTLANPSALREFGVRNASNIDVEKFAASLEVYRSDGTPRPVEEAPPLRALQGEIIRNQEEILRTFANGELRHRQVSATPVKNAAGDIIGSVSVVRDITELKETESRLTADLLALTRMHQLSRRVAETADIEPLLQEIIDTAVAIVHADKGTLQLLDGNALRIVAHHGHERPFLDFFAVAENVASVCGEATRRGERIIVHDVEASPIFAGTASLPVLRTAGVRAVQSTPLRTRGGQLLGILTTHWSATHTPDEHNLWRIDLLARQASDLIEQKQTELALQEANATLEKKIEERTQQLRALTGELTLAEQRERSRLANVLHDHLQQVLVAAKFRLTILGRGGDDVVKQATKEVEELIDESILASRSLTAELSPPILHEAGLSEGLQWLARRMADTQGLFVDLELNESGPLPEDLKILLFQSVRELLFNVVKHAHTRSAAVNLRRLEDSLLVTVSDQGAGFNPAKMPPAGEGGRGFGLLGILERLKYMGGTLEIESTPGHGSRFMLIVPIAPPTAKEPPSQGVPGLEKKLPVPSKYSNLGRKIRVLLVDDHAVVRQGIGNLLESELDIEVVGQAADGQEAVDLAANLLPDVILMDVSMPKLNGVEATRAIGGKFPGIHIIGLSMFDDADRAQAMHDAGASDYVTKSGPASILIEAIRKCL